ncbi:hypothetical protein [Labrys miyagiensis]|uniref:hypothetical protein n=1 Tax=Labrys miyagiensis TaxID=346912 RepID=UPI0024E1547C|nr:hypothetical protein [Labrys miyagiensis]
MKKTILVLSIHKRQRCQLGWQDGSVLECQGLGSQSADIAATMSAVMESRIDPYLTWQLDNLGIAALLSHY